MVFTQTKRQKGHLNSLNNTKKEPRWTQAVGQDCPTPLMLSNNASLLKVPAGDPMPKPGGHTMAGDTPRLLSQRWGKLRGVFTRLTLVSIPPPSSAAWHAEASCSRTWTALSTAGLLTVATPERVSSLVNSGVFYVSLLRQQLCAHWTGAPGYSCSERSTSGWKKAAGPK